MSEQKEWKYWWFPYLALAVLIIGVIIFLCAFARADDSGSLTIDQRLSTTFMTLEEKWPDYTYLVSANKHLFYLTVNNAPNALLSVNANVTRVELCHEKKCATIHIDVDRVWYEGELPVEDSARAFFEAMRIVRGGGR